VKAFRSGWHVIFTDRDLLGGVGVSESSGKVGEALDEDVDLGGGEDRVGPGARELLRAKWPGNAVRFPDP